MLVNTLVFSHVTRGGVREGRFQWGVVGKYLFAAPVLRGIVVTLELTAIAMAAGIVLGIVLAIMRLSPSRLVSGTAWVYIWFFRGTPVLVQIIFWYEGISYLYPRLDFGVPFGPEFFTVNANTLVTSFVAGALGLSLNEGAYMAEIVRAGIISVDEGQTEAAQSIGMTRFQTLRRIVLPQAMRVIIPPTGNETISMLKTTSLVYAIAGDRTVHRHPEHLQRQLRGRPPPPGGQPLVSLLHLVADHRAVLRRALLRPGIDPRPAADPAPAAAPVIPPRAPRPGRPVAGSPWVAPHE